VVGGGLLIVTGLVLWIKDSKGTKLRNIEDLTVVEFLMIKGINAWENAKNNAKFFRKK